MKSKVLIASSLAAGILLACTSASEAGEAKARSQRGQLVHQIVMKWGNHVQEAYRADVAAWAKAMGSSFATASISSLERAAKAKNFDAMNDALLDKESTVNAMDVSPQALGDPATDLVFVPVSPCRIFDTRLAGGAIAAGAVRSFDVTAIGDYSSQGGASGNCGGVGAVGSFAAAVINFTWVAPAQSGYFTAFPYLETQPLAATAIYGAGQISSNLSVVKLDQGASAMELSIYSERQLHLVADIVGYYIAPAVPTLQCQDTADTVVNVNAGGTANATAPACPAGHAQTATNCESSTWQMPFVYFSGGTCSAQNNSAGVASLRASRTCCRVQP